MNTVRAPSRQSTKVLPPSNPTGAMALTLLVLLVEVWSSDLEFFDHTRDPNREPERPWRQERPQTAGSSRGGLRPAPAPKEPEATARPFSAPSARKTASSNFGSRVGFKSEEGVFQIDRVRGRATYSRHYNPSPGMVVHEKGSGFSSTSPTSSIHPGSPKSPKSPKGTKRSPSKGKEVAKTDDPLSGLRWVCGEGGLEPLGSNVDSDSEEEVDTRLQHAPISRGKLKGRSHGCLCSAGNMDVACESLYIEQGRVWLRQHERACLAAQAEKDMAKLSEMAARQQVQAPSSYKRTWGDKAEGRKWQVGGGQERRRRGSASMTHGLTLTLTLMEVRPR